MSDADLDRRVADLDRRVAEIVGWDWYQTPALQKENSLPSLYIDHAIAALEAMRAKGWCWQVQCYSGDDSGPLVSLWRLNRSDDDFQISRVRVNEIADTIPLAICRAIVETEEKS